MCWQSCFFRNHLLSELLISCGNLTAFVISKNALAFCGSFHRTDRMRYLRIKHLDFLTVVTFYRCRDFLRNVGIIMLNQASTDRIELAKLLNISDLQMSYITNVGAGQGLLKVGSSLVPFINKFPRNTELYRLMTTKFGEV